MSEMTTDVHRPLLTIGEVAARLRVSERTVRRLVAKGELVAYRLGPPGSSVRVDALALDRWLRDPGETEDDPLRLGILAAHDRGDQEELERLQAEFRATKV